MNDELIQVLAAATQAACTALTSQGRAALQASLDRACGTPAGCSWERRAAAHAEFFTTLADAAGAAGDPRAAPVLSHGADLAYALMADAERARPRHHHQLPKADARPPARRNAAQAATEMEKHLAILSFMSRLATTHPPAPPTKN